MKAPLRLPPYDAKVRGAGPAGCACALWLVNMGYRVALIEREPQLLPTLKRFDFSQNWVLGFAQTSLQTIAVSIEQQIVQAQRTQGGALDVFLNASEPQADALLAGAQVYATGVVPKRGPLTMLAPDDAAQVWDAVRLTQARAHLHGQRILLLGGGDNAAENALGLAQQGNHVVLWSRSAWRAQTQLVQALEAWASSTRSSLVGRVTLRLNRPLPHRIEQQSPQSTPASPCDWRVHSAPFGVERFDHVVVLWGFEPQGGERNRAALAALEGQGTFLAGDLSGRLHPCVQTALADGVVAAKRVQAFLQNKKSINPSKRTT